LTAIGSGSEIGLLASLALASMDGESDPYPVVLKAEPDVSLLGDLEVKMDEIKRPCCLLLSAASCKSRDLLLANNVVEVDAEVDNGVKFNLDFKLTPPVENRLAVELVPKPVKAAFLESSPEELTLADTLSERRDVSMEDCRRGLLTAKPELTPEELASRLLISSKPTILFHMYRLLYANVLTSFANNGRYLPCHFSGEITHAKRVLYVCPYRCSQHDVFRRRLT